MARNEPDRPEPQLARQIESSSKTDPDGECPMPDKTNTIPEKARWEVPTKGLTGPYIAILNAFLWHPEN
jgi:hypothetical protein